MHPADNGILVMPQRACQAGLCPPDTAGTGTRAAR